jgi:hypothetical protein
MNDRHDITGRLSGLLMIVAGAAMIGFLLNDLEKRPGGSNSPIEVFDVEIDRIVSASRYRSEASYTVRSADGEDVPCSINLFTDESPAEGDRLSLERRQDDSCGDRVHVPRSLGGGWMILILGSFFVLFGGLTLIFPSMASVLDRLQSGP